MHFNNSTQTLTPVEESGSGGGETKSSFRFLSVRNLKLGAWCGLVLLVIVLSIVGVWYLTRRTSDAPASHAEQRLVSQVKAANWPTQQPQHDIPVIYTQLDLFDIKDHIEETRKINLKRFGETALKIEILNERLNILEREVVRLKSRSPDCCDVKSLNKTTKENNTDVQANLRIFNKDSSPNKTVNAQINLETKLNALNETMIYFQEKVQNDSKSYERKLQQQNVKFNSTLKAMENATNAKIVNLRKEIVYSDRLKHASLQVMINNSCQMLIKGMLSSFPNQSIDLMKSHLHKDFTNFSKETKDNSSFSSQEGANLKQILLLQKQVQMVNSSLKTHNQCCAAVSRQNASEPSIKTVVEKYKSLAVKFNQLQANITTKLNAMQDTIDAFDSKTTKDLRTLNETLIQSINSTEVLKLENDKDLFQCQCNITNELREFRAESKTYVEVMMGIEKTDRIRGDLSLRNSLNSLQYSQFNRRLNVVEAKLRNARTLIGDNSNSTGEFKRMLQGKLDAGWIQAPNGRAYLVLRNVGSWYEASDSCVKANGQLAYQGIRNEAMRGFIQSNLVHPAGGTGAWIGLRRQLRNTPWFWLDGQFLVRSKSNWLGGQPNYYTEGRACAMTTSAFGKWNDLSCSAKIRAVHALCERPSSADAA